jgi:hypothetical protein
MIKTFDAAHRDCIIGDMQTPEAGLQQGRWNVFGVMQNATPACNLDMRQPELAELAQLIRKLKASSSP